MDYWLLRDGEKYGPYSKDQLSEFAEQGNLGGADRLWHQGLSDWEAPALVLPSLEAFNSGELATGDSNSTGSPTSKQHQPIPVREDEQRPRRASFLRSGLTWIPLFSGLLVAVLGFQPFLNAVAAATISEELEEQEGWLKPEQARALAGGTIGLFAGYSQQNTASRFLSWVVAFLVGAVNGLSFGAALSWLASLLTSSRGLWARVAICSGLGGAVGFVLNFPFGHTPLALLVGFLGLREGLLLGACFGAVQTLDELRTCNADRRELKEAT